jgi:hypothetical protein
MAVGLSAPLKSIALCLCLCLCDCLGGSDCMDSSRHSGYIVMVESCDGDPSVVCAVYP